MTDDLTGLLEVGTFNDDLEEVIKATISENGETNVKVEITVNDKDDYLKPDFNVDVRIVTEKIK